MSESFDPYLQWLGIREPERPPNHYRLLGIDLFESDPQVIANAADRQMAYVRMFQSGPHAALSQRLLNEIATARVCLLTSERKAVYDAQLRGQTTSQAFEPPSDSPTLADTRKRPATTIEPDGPNDRLRRPVTALIVAGCFSLALMVTGFALLVYDPQGKRLEGANGEVDSSHAKPALPDAPSNSPAQEPAVPNGPAPSETASANDDARGVDERGANGEDSETTAGDEQPPPASREPRGDTGADDAASPSPPDAAGGASQITKGPASSDGWFSTPGPPADPSEPSPAVPAQPRWSRPPDDAVEEKLAEIRELYNVEYSRITGRGDSQSRLSARVQLSRELLRAGRQTENDPAARYALLDEAADLAVTGGDTATLEACIRELCASFGLDRADETVRRIRSAAESALPVDSRIALARLALRWIDRLAEEDRYTGARALADVVYKLALRQDASLTRIARVHQSRLAVMQQEYEAYQEVLSRFGDDGESPAVRTARGRYLCFVKNDWEEGLPLLAQGEDEQLRRLAEAELQASESPDLAAMEALGEAWFTAAEGVSGFTALAMNRRARTWFERALPRASGFTARKLEARLAEINTRLERLP